MSIASEITRLQSAKSTLKTKINAKNDENHQIDDETLDEYGDFVDSISTGIDTSDADATAGDILYSKTAYVNGEKITGSMTNNGSLSYTPATSSQSIPSGYTSGGTIAAVTSSIDNNITAENIKKDVTILGVTGSFEGGGSLTIDSTTVKFAGSTFTTFPDWLKNATFTGNLYKGFGDLYSLVNVPNLNFSNVTTVESLFENCSVLETVGLFDLCSSTTLQRMFNNCYKLKGIPQYDTSNIQYFNYLFWNCDDLEDVPLLDTSKVKQTGFSQVFRSGHTTKLTNESLNNIMRMCINAVNVTNSSYKKLSSVGLSSANATTCQSLSNWSDFVAAGWITGY